MLFKYYKNEVMLFGVKVVCRECGNRLEREDAYLFETINERALKIDRKYYCDINCYEKKEKRKELIIKCNDLMEEILNIPIRTNIYFNKLYSPIIKVYDYDVIYEFLISEKDYIENQLEGKDFKTINTKLKYFLAIMQNKIGKYKDIVKNKESFKEELKKPIFEDEIEFKPITDNKKRSIEDILNSL